MLSTRTLAQILTLAVLPITYGFGQVFTSTNEPGSLATFSFSVSSPVTNLSLMVSNSPTAWSHLLLRRGSPPTDTEYDFISQLNGVTNAIHLESAELVPGTYHLGVRTPAESSQHSFSIPVVSNSAGMRTAAKPVSKPQDFTATGSLTNGQWHYFRVEIPPNSPGWRMVVQSTGPGIPQLFVRKDSPPDLSNYLKTSLSTITLTDSEAVAGAYFVGVYLASTTTAYTLYSETGYLNVLTWDPGTTHPGTEVFTNQSPSGGDYYFLVTTENTSVEAWRTALKVTSGEANLYIAQGFLPNIGQYAYKSENAGSDGFVIRGGLFAPSQQWYILVTASPGAQWTLLSGEAYVQDLGVIATNSASSSGPVTMGPEGYRFFKTTTTPQTLAWRLWLNGAGNRIYVRKSECALDGQADLFQDGQMLVVPDYLDVGSFNGSYFVGVPGVPGSMINLDSRQQAVTDLPFPGTNTLAVTGYGYTTYRVQVPVEQIAWDVKVTPTVGNPNVAVRRSKVPNEWNNDAFSEVPGSVADSISLVPPTLSDGTFFITVYGQGNHTFTLTSKNPVVTDINFISSTINDDVNRAGWRYYRVSDIPSQLGYLGWYLEVSNHVVGTEVTLRRNAVPGRWYYRNNGSTGFNQGSVDYGRPNYLQRPGHPADIWYVGIFQPSNSLGAFHLQASALTAPTQAFNSASVVVSDQPADTWRFFRIDVPTNTLGWDIRLTGVTSGDPRLVVRRDQLPSDLTTSGYWIPYTWGTGPHQATNWISGQQWSAGYDWTERYYDGPSSTAYRYGHILAMGMNNPLEAGTYYIGVTGGGGTNALGYTLQSRGIGPGFAIPVVDLDFQNVSITNTLAPREAAYYRVTITNNPSSWKARLNPTVGEALMQVQMGYLPNIQYGAFTYNTASPLGGERMSKAGPEHWVALPESYTNAIPNGVYYIAVVSEGQNPPDQGTIGSGTSTYVIQSLGALGVTNLGTLSEVDLVQADSVEGGTFKAYQFTVPSNTLSMEVRLEGRVGQPEMTLARTNQLPYPYHSYGTYGGLNPQYWDDDLITIANPAAGVYSFLVYAWPTNNSLYFSYPDASYTVRVHAVTTTEVGFDGGTATVSNQPAAEWRYFKVTVPTNTLGWDIRLVNVTNSNPKIVVRRDTLPASFDTSYWVYFGNLYPPSSGTNWPSGNQWAAGSDWTDRVFDNYSHTINADGRILAMGMGNPLEAGSYFVGVSGGAGGGTNPLSYTLQSRGIGPGFAIPVVDLDFQNGSITNTLAPREAAYYRVTITNNPSSWKARLNPTVGEALMQVQMGYLPNIQYGAFTYNTASPLGGEKMSKAGPEQWVALPEYGTNVISNGVYYIAVVGEGQNATNTSVIGSGNSTYVIQSLGALGVTNLGALSEVDLVQADSVEGGTFKAYQFTVPSNTLSMELRLENRVGNPRITAVATNLLPYPITTIGNPYSGYGYHGGHQYDQYDDDLITWPNPKPGTYSLVVQASPTANDYWSFPNASYTLRVRRQEIPSLNFSASLNTNGFSNSVTGLLANTQSAFYRVDVPAAVDGQPVVGWRLSLVETQGVASVRVRKTILPADQDHETSPFRNASMLVSPPYLTPGTWYVEVKGNGSTAFTLTSMNFTPDRPVWIMPFSGQTNSTPGLGGTPYFGDTGTDPSGAPLPGDRGVDLENGKFHYYAVQVPSNNAVLIRTWLEAISGNPDLYIRVGVPPTTDHSSCGSDYGGSCSNLYDRIMDQSATEYGNWVPLDGKYESFLPGGTWHFAVRAASGANCRYRLRISAGEVQDLALQGGSMVNQTLAARDWRYYRVTIPTNAPQSWTVGFSQQAGDVVMYIRDTSPPGHGMNSQSDYRSWGPNPNWPYIGDNKNDGPYNVYDPAGNYTFPVPPIRPGHTYYVGFRAVVDATFSVTSSVSVATIPMPIVLAHYGGYYSNSIAAGSSVLFRIDVPHDAARIAFTNRHAAGVSVFLEQGTLPYLDHRADWQSYGNASSSVQQNLSTNAWPWQPGHAYYLKATNGTGVAQPFAISALGTRTVGDSDGDGLPDWWETLYEGYALNPAFSNAAGSNADSDPFTDWEEYVADTHPGLSGSYFPLVDASNAPSGLMALVIESTSTGRLYGVRWTTNLLANPQTWNLYAPERTGTGSALIFHVTNELPNRVYRTGVRLP